MNAVRKISTPKFLYVCVQTVFKKKFIYFYDKYMKKKRKVFTLTCAGLKSFQWKLFMLWSLNFKGRCCPNQMTNSLKTKTKIKTILYSDCLPNLSIFPTSRSFGNRWDFAWVTHVTLRYNTRDNKYLNSQGFNE